MQPVLVHLSKNKEGTYSFDPVSVNFMTEILKTVFAVITLFIFVSACLWIYAPQTTLALLHVAHMVLWCL